MILYLLTYLILSILFNVLLYLIAYRLQTDKLTDVAYSLSFILLSSLLVYFSEMNFSQIIIAILINVWAFRLGTYLFQRILKRKSDERFNEIRPNKWSFLKFWVLQGFAVWIILLPALFFFYNEVQSLFYPGIIIWTVGFLFESIADYQKSRFKKTAKSKEAFISSGLFKYARYPNYFGEIACWAGIYLIVLPGLDIYQMTISILSPLFIFILLRYFTGIPPLEKISNERRKNNPAFIIYRDKTNLLFPWFPGK